MYTLIKNLLKRYKMIMKLKLLSNFYLREIERKFDNKKLVQKYQNEINECLNEIKKEIGFYQYLIFKSNDYYVNDVNTVIEKIKNHQDSRLKYIENLHNNIDTALDCGLENKLYFPLRKYHLYSDYDINNFYNILKGISQDNIINFLEHEGILNKNKALEIINNAKILPDNGNDIWWGIFEENAVKNSKVSRPRAIIPKINGEESILINIHELVHIACIYRNNVELAKSVFTNALISQEEMEELAVFYELLYKKLYGFKTDIHILPNSLTLLSDYKNERFAHQIIKLKNLNKIKRDI